MAWNPANDSACIWRAQVAKYSRLDSGFWRMVTDTSLPFPRFPTLSRYLRNGLLHRAQPPGIPRGEAQGEVRQDWLPAQGHQD